MALVLPQGYEHSRQIREGVVVQLERSQGWQLLQLPFFHSGRAPLRSGIDSLAGVVTWTDREFKWITELTRKGIPVVNCSGALLGMPCVASVVGDLPSVLKLGLRHFIDLSLWKIYYFGHRVASDPGRQAAAQMLADLGAAEGLEVSSMESRARNPDENLETLLAPESEQALVRKFAALQGPVGIFAEDDYFARLACNLALHVGKRIPADVAVIGAGGDLLGRFGGPTTSTILLPGKEIGEAAFRLIDRFHAGGALPAGEVRIKASTLVVRESTGGKARDVAMERVFRLIEREACRGLTVQELADETGISPRTLRQRYRKVHGMEPSEHIRNQRMATAKRLLKSSDRPVSVAASICGFSSLAAFYNYFLRHEGISPTDYRSRKRDNPR